MSNAVVQCTLTTPNYTIEPINSQKKLALIAMGSGIGNLPQNIDKTISNMEEFNVLADTFQKDAQQFQESEDSVLKNDKFKRIQTLETNKKDSATGAEKPLTQTLTELVSTYTTLTQVADYSSDYKNAPMDEASILAMAAQVSNSMVELSYNVAVSLTRLTQSFQGVMDMLASLQKILAYVQGYYTAAISSHNSADTTHTMSTWDLGTGDEGMTNFGKNGTGEEWANKVHLDGNRVYLTGLAIPDNVKQFFPNGQIDANGIESLLSMVSSSLAAILPDSASFESTNKGVAYNSATIQTFIDNCGTKIKSVNDLLSTYTNQIETAQNAAQQGLSFFSSINNIMNQLIQKLF